MSDLAERVHVANTNASKMESELFEALDKVFSGGEPFDDFITDSYDNSIELLGCQSEFVPTDEQLRAILALGFVKGWMCYANGTEHRFGCEPGGGGFWRSVDAKRSLRGDTSAPKVRAMRARLSLLESLAGELVTKGRKVLAYHETRPGGYEPTQHTEFAAVLAKAAEMGIPNAK